MKSKVLLLRSFLIASFLLLFSTFISAQTTPVSGKVTSSTGEPLAGVTVLVKNGRGSAITGADGSYRINVPSSSSVLVFSSVGFGEKEVPVNGNSQLAVSLVSNSASLDDVVVIGYGTRRKTDVTGSVSSITGENLRTVPTTNLTQSLQGRIPGLEVKASSFRPGAGSRVRVRGNRSLGANTGVGASNDPLYVVDGIPVTYTIDDMNPADIETVDVLKDASSTAIYGSRGANGVIQITTKKAKTGKLSVQYDGSVSFDNILKNLPVFNGPQLADAWRQAFFADGIYNFAQNSSSPNNYFPSAAADAKLFGGFNNNPMWNFIKDAYQFTTFNPATNTYIAVKRPTTEEEKSLLRNLGLTVLTEVDAYDPSKVKSYDWQKDALRTGMVNSHNINVSIGTDKIKSSFSGSYFKQKGIEFGQDYTRYTVGNNTEFRPTTFLTFGNNISFTNSLQNLGTSIYTNSATSMLPFTTPTDSAGNFLLYPNPSDNLIINARGDVNTVLNQVKTNRIFGNIFAEVSLFKGLRYRTVFGIDSRNSQQGRFNGVKSSVKEYKPGTADASNTITNSFSWVYDNLIYYDLNIKKDHQFKVTLLQELQSLNKSNTVTMSAQNLIFEEQKWYSLNRNTLASVTGSGTYRASQLLSFMGRLEYGYKNKYLLTLSSRYDKSSVLSQQNNGVNFPAAAIAWRIDNENFFRRQQVFSNANIRLGIGSVGSSNIDPYQTGGPLDFTLYNWGNGNAAIGSSPLTYPVPNLTWEKTTTRNLRLEFGLLKNRVNAAIDIYSTTTIDQLQRLTIPATNGVTYILANIGEVSNKGIDIALSSVNLNTPGGFRWTTDIVFSKNKEAIVSIDGVTKNDNLANLLFIGQPISTYYNFKATGIYQYADTAKGGYLSEYLWQKGVNRTNIAFRPGKIRVADLNGDTLINNNDKTVLGYDNADWTGSIGNTLSYKNFDLNFLIYIRKGSTYRVPRPGLVGRYQSYYANYWTPTNPSNEYQQPTRITDIPVYWESLQYRDGSFVRVKNISLTYRVPQQLLTKMKISNLSVYVNAVNPFLFHKASDYDPETFQFSESFNSGTGNSTPNSYSYRSMVLGVRLGL